MSLPVKGRILSSYEHVQRISAGHLHIPAFISSELIRDTCNIQSHEADSSDQEHFILILCTTETCDSFLWNIRLMQLGHS